uniref:HTH_7 domain-containing protein n=1 Tax=Heterorhabditis bacteriophora TaxID=37862 RepID=A0A1I7WSE9_HETBA
MQTGARITLPIQNQVERDRERVAVAKVVPLIYANDFALMRFCCTSSNQEVKQRKLLAILTKHLTREPSTNLQLNIGFEDFVTETSLEDEEGRGHSLVVDDGQLRAIAEVDPRKTTREITEELNVSQSGVRYLHRIGKLTNLDQWVLHELNESQKFSLQNLLYASLAQQKKKYFLITL